MTERLGVAAALVDGVVVAGDVEISSNHAAAMPGVVERIGIRDGRGGRGLAVPGFVDLQVNGFGGVDFRRCDPAGFLTAAWQMASHGVTAFQPTLYSRPLKDYREDLATLSEAMISAERQLQGRGGAGYGDIGAQILPAHLEGPFLSPLWSGAHDPEHLCQPDSSVLEMLLSAGPVGFVTIAPELPGAIELISELCGRGLVVSVGHCDATAEEVRLAVDAGARHLTHCWNAHRRLSARDPGPAGEALVNPQLTVGLICDLVHVSQQVILTTFAAAAGRVAVTTDALAQAGLDAAELRDTTPDEPLRGGRVGLAECLRNLVSCGVALPTAVDACGGAQRRLLGIGEVKLRPGDQADLVVLDDELRPLRTFVAGREVWSA